MRGRITHLGCARRRSRSHADDGCVFIHAALTAFRNVLEVYGDILSALIEQRYFDRDWHEREFYAGVGHLRIERHGQS